ncbi:MAG TPA: amino acid adenylation domain-containing protein [Candidatus Angelobacter sp.]
MATQTASAVEGVALSPQQYRVWRLQQENERGALRTRFTISILGPVDYNRLQAAWHQVQEQHQIFRTTFEYLPGIKDPLQVVQAEGTPMRPVKTPVSMNGPFRTTLFSDMEEGKDACPNTEAIVALYKVNQEQHLLAFSFPVLLADGETARIIFQELCRSYDSSSGAAPADTIQYAQFSEWFSELLAGEEIVESRDYWQRRGGCAPTEFPLRKQMGAASSSPSLLPLSLSTGQQQALENMAQNLGATVRDLLFTCWQVLLYRFTGQSPIVVGSLVDGRKYEELDAMPGLAGRYLPVACELDSEITFKAAVERVLAESKSVYQNQEGFPFKENSSDGNLPPSLPVAFENYTLPGAQSFGNTVFSLDAVVAEVDYADLVLCCNQHEPGLTLALRFNPAAYSPQYVSTIAECYTTLLESATRRPEMPLADLSLLNEREFLGWVDRLNSTQRTFSGPAFVQDVIAQAAKGHWSEVAIEGNGVAVSYGKLQAEADALAQRLHSLGVSPDSVVGIIMEHSPELIVAILGVLRSGAAYLPIDPTLPQERIAYMLEDSHAGLLLAKETSASSLPERRPQVLLLKPDWQSPATPDYSIDSSVAHPLPENLAYLIYTSGSTGAPKASMITHGGLSNYLAWACEAYAIAERAGAPLHSSIGFDLTVTSLFGPLMAGKKVVLASMESLADCLRSHRDFSLLKVTPAHARLLGMQLASSEAPEKLGYLILGGEALRPGDVAFWSANAPGVVLINEYGPTETVVGCCVYQFPGAAGDSESVPIGKPIANTQIYLLDRELRPVPIGVTGEIYVAGHGLARGYLGRPALTAERFLPHSFSTDPGARMYRTGDLGRYLTDGIIDCLGRTDHQVKVRGYRVELGEVESVLAKLPAVSQVCVLARNTERGTQLVAYLVGTPEGQQATLPVSEVRAHLSKYLPEYMVPAAYVWLKELPLTGNGKVDRKALPSPDNAQTGAGQHTEPRTLEEELLCGIWSQVLSAQRVGIDDNYFGLGGDSIRSLQIITRSAERGLKFTVGDIFRYQTIRTLAQNLENLKAAPEVTAGPFSLIKPEDQRLVPQDAEAAYPLTRLQAGMVFHRELHPESAVYHDIGTFHLQTPLREQLVAEAIQKVVARHPALRTSFDLVTYSQPLQIVHRDAPVPVTFDDLTHLDVPGQEKALQEWAEADKRRGFDVTQYPLVRFQVHRRSADTFQFTLCFHHAILDGWSDASMLTEIAQTYYQQLHGETYSPLPPETQFRDFVLLELQAIASAEHQRFWQERLEESEFLRVPRWKPTPITTRRGVGFHEVEISDELSNALKRVALAAAVPVKTVLLAAHMRALAMLSGNTDVTTFLTSVGRPETRDGDRVFGLFLNSTPFRLKLSGGKWRKLLEDTFAVEREAVPFRRYPLAEMQKLLGRDQISETGFYFTHYHIYHGLEQYPDFKLLQHNYYEETNITLLANFALASFTNKVRFYLTCDQTEIGKEQLAAIAGYYHRVLIEMAAHPEGRYDSLNLLSDAEYEIAVAAGPENIAQLESQACIHEQFSRQAVQSPESTAVSDDKGRLTYHQLQLQSNQLAHYLQALGVKPDGVVGLLLERSQDLATSVLGVLKAGGAYLPLDPGYPPERLAFILRDAQVSVLITQEKFRERLADLPVRTLYIDAERDSFSRLSNSAPRAVATLDTLAYIIYTSGSTGTPKGVMVTHRNLANYISWCVATYLPVEGQGSLVHSSISFDLTVTAMLAPLAVGQTVTMVPDAEGITALAQSLVSCRNLSFVKLTPIHLRLLRGQIPEGDLARHTRSLLLGGEALHNEDVQFWREAAPECILINEYGPTEATVGCSVFSVPSGTSTTNSGDVSIGKPITNTTLYVLDEFLQPAPTLTPGELYIGGACVARGYLAWPDLTAEKFIPDPFSKDPGRRLYRTGDLARRLVDSNLDFLGRRDNQLKLRGFRIEVGEIESALKTHAGVGQAVVLARTFKNADRLLVAYVVPAGPRIEADELRSFLLRKLPDYMVPAVFVMLERLPLTRNGKLDRAALPDPEASRSAGLAEFVAPRTQEEQILAGVWAKVLHLERVGIDDDYFALGGDSIRSIQIVSLSRERGLQFALHQLFQNPTVRRLAEALRDDQIRSVKHDATEPLSLISDADRALLPSDIEDAYPLSRLQAGMLYHRELHPQAAIYHDVMSFHIKAPFQFDLLQEAIGQLCARHPALRTSFDLTHYSEPLQLVHRSVPSPLAVDDLRHLDPEAQESAIADWVEADKARGFDIAQPPLLRFQVHLRSGQTFQFTLCFHHAILDGWSDASMQLEIAQSYMFLLHGEAPPFSPLQTQYHDFIALEQQAIKSSTARQFWSQKLEGAEPIVLPRWTQPAAGSSNRRGVYRVDVPISPEISDQLQKLALSAAVPLKTMLLAGHLEVMQWISGRQDVLTAIASNGRPETSDGERVLGLFLNLTPFRLSLAQATGSSLLKSTFAAEREVLLYRRYPLAEIQQLSEHQRLSETAFYFTHYHIYHQLQRFGELEVLGYKVYEESSFTMVAMFSVDPFTNRLTAQLCCDRTQVAPEYAELMASWYEQALAALATETEATLRSSPALSPAQQHLVLEDWNATQQEYPHDETISRLFEDQVRRTPLATALIYEDRTLTYAELNNRANQMANWLRRRGAGPETMVGVCMERSLETCVALLGIVKAGAAYVPLDPSYPPPRLGFLAKDSRTSFVLTTRKLQAVLGESVPQVICLDEFWNEIAAEKDLDPESNGSSQNLAYIMYTSGSTGVPKGVAVPHQGVIRLVKNNCFADLSGVPTFLQFAPLSFDASTFETWGALLNGGRLAIYPASSASLEDLGKAIQRHGVSVLWLTAPLFHQIVDYSADVFKPLRTLISGGDVLSPTHVIKTLSHLENGVMVNAYGPTESTTFACCHSVRRAEDIGATVPIGRPISNTQVYVLNQEMDLLPPGIAGELFIGGDGLARGYFHQPGLTAEKFVPHPYSSEPGARLYRTGDTVRYRADGTIEFLGRIDSQVKIRGFRVELGEVKSVLQEHPAVQEVAATARGTGSSNKRVVAYVTLRDGCEAQSSELKEFLRGRVPEFMVPSAIVILAALPLKPSGKIDDEALSKFEEHDEERPFSPPQTALETELADLWSQVLGVTRVGREDNFFDLGGHSLLATQLVSRVRDRYQVALPIRELMAAPTLADFTEAVQTATWASRAQQENSVEDTDKEEFIV